MAHFCYSLKVSSATGEHDAASYGSDVKKQDFQKKPKPVSNPLVWHLDN